MAKQNAQYLRCASSLVIQRTSMYASFLEIRGALILNILLCHPKSTFL